MNGTGKGMWKMAHVFISYKREEEAFAKELEVQLRKAQFEVWRDEQIPGGKAWLEEVKLKIHESFVLIVVATPESMESGWVNYEWIFGQGAGIDIVPIHLKTVNKFPCRLDDYQLIDFRSEYAWGNLTARLRDINQYHIYQDPLQRAKTDINDTNPQIRKNGIATLIEMNAIEALAASLYHPTRSVRIDAAFGLCKVTEFADKRATLGLLEALKDPEWSTKRDAANALGKLGDSTATPALGIALNDIVGDVRLAAAHALGEIGDASSITPLVNTLKNSTYPAVQNMAGDSLARIGKTAVHELVDVIHDKDAGDHAHIEAACALGIIGDPIAVPDLLNLLLDKSWEIRRSAIKALGKIGDAVCVKDFETSW